MPSLYPHRKYQRWPQPQERLGGWWKPVKISKAQKKKGYGHLGVINALLPYMSDVDVDVMRRQVYTGAGGEKGLAEQFKGYIPVPPVGPPPTTVSAARPGGIGTAYRDINKALGGIKDKTAQNWAKSVFDIYKAYTPKRGMRSRLQEKMLQTELDELFANVPEAAQPYAAAMQRLVKPTVAMPGLEWYQMPQAYRTAPTSWSAMGYTRNPMWM
jgi:hypothetical protein